MIVAGDLGSTVERDALCLRLDHQGVTVAVVADGAYEHGTWPTLTVPHGCLSAETLQVMGDVTALLSKVPRQAHSTEGALSGYAVLLRHGHASYSGPAFPSAGAVFPSGTDLTLTPRGEAQVRLAASTLRAYSPTVIYCSALLRARQTADIVAQTLGGVEIVYDARLNEREFVPLHGLTGQRIAELYGNDFLHAFTTTPDKAILDGVDGLPQCQARVLEFFAELPDSGVQRPLVVAHGGPFAWLVSFVMELPLDRSRRWHMGHGALSTIVTGPPIRLVSWNARCVEPDALP